MPEKMLLWVHLHCAPVCPRARRFTYEVVAENDKESWPAWTNSIKLDQPLCNPALLAIKWREEQGKPFWHWVLFIRENGEAKVLDSKKALKSNVRRNFGRIKPKWYIEVAN